jgi:hypothetical protein
VTWGHDLPPITMCEVPRGHNISPEPWPAPDAGYLLSLVAEALNALENAGITVDLAGGAVMTPRGYVMAIGDDRLGSRWQARTRLWTQLSPADESSDD